MTSEPMTEQNERSPLSAPLDLLHHQPVGHARRAQPAVLGRDRRADHAQAGQPARHVERERQRLGVLLDDRQDVLGDVGRGRGRGAPSPRP